MFTLEQIEKAHERVSSGADFPKYIQTIKSIGVLGFITWVCDSHTEYFGENEYCIKSNSKYVNLKISDISEVLNFKYQIKQHQLGKTDYLTFCKDCAVSGIEKWVVNLNEMTCTYYDKVGVEVIIEQIPS